MDNKMAQLSNLCYCFVCGVDLGSNNDRICSDCDIFKLEKMKNLIGRVTEMNDKEMNEILSPIMTVDEVQNYLDKAIRFWRGKRNSSNQTELLATLTIEEEIGLTATYYTDAYQDIRLSLFGKILEEVEIKKRNVNIIDVSKLDVPPLHQAKSLTYSHFSTDAHKDKYNREQFEREYESHFFSPSIERTDEDV